MVACLAQTQVQCLEGDSVSLYIKFQFIYRFSEGKSSQRYFVFIQSLIYNGFQAVLYRIPWFLGHISPNPTREISYLLDLYIRIPGKSFFDAGRIKSYTSKQQKSKLLIYYSQVVAVTYLSTLSSHIVKYLPW